MFGYFASEPIELFLSLCAETRNIELGVVMMETNLYDPVGRDLAVASVNLSMHSNTNTC